MSNHIQQIICLIRFQQKRRGRLDLAHCFTGAVICLLHNFFSSKSRTLLKDNYSISTPIGPTSTPTTMMARLLIRRADRLGRHNLPVASWSSTGAGKSGFCRGRTSASVAVAEGRVYIKFSGHYLYHRSGTFPHRLLEDNY